jgi:hypothetical protein
MSFGGKNLTRGREKGRKCKRKRKKGERKRKKGHDGSKKKCCKRRKKYHFQKGGGINIDIEPKYRPCGLH